MDANLEAALEKLGAELVESGWAPAKEIPEVFEGDKPSGRQRYIFIARLFLRRRSSEIRGLVCSNGRPVAGITATADVVAALIELLRPFPDLPDSSASLANVLAQIGLEKFCSSQ